MTGYRRIEKLLAFLKLMLLEEGWDSYGAKKIEQGPISAASTCVLEEAQVVPTPGGGVQLEWHVHGQDIEVEFHPDGTITGSWEREGTELPPAG